MQITTSWMEQGIEQGLESGAKREKELIIRQLKRKLGEINSEIEAQIKALNIDKVEALGEALLDFSNIEDLNKWLRNN